MRCSIITVRRGRLALSRETQALAQAACNPLAWHVRILDRYLLRELLIPLGYCLGAFWILWIASSLLTELADFQKDGLSASEVVQYYALRTPEIMVMLVPIGFLLALLYALTDMARHQELTAMRAAGVGLWRIALPYFGIGTILSLGVFAVNELYVPQSIEAAREAKHRRRTEIAPGNKDWKRQLGFVNSRQRRKWFMEAYNVRTSEMIKPHVEWILTTGTRCEIWADRGIYEEGRWVFTNVQEQVFTPNPGEWPTLTKTNLMLQEFSETPEQIRSEIKISNINDLREVNRRQLSLREILDYKNLHDENTARSAMLDTMLHGRLATPWTCLIVVLIALPFGAVTGRRNVAVGVASSIVICFGYYVLTYLAAAVGTRGSVPPWLAAWTPNLIFGFTGLFLTYRAR